MELAIAREAEQRVVRQTVARVQAVRGDLLERVFADTKDWAGIVEVYRQYQSYLLNTEIPLLHGYTFVIPEDHPARVFYDKLMSAEEIVGLITTNQSNYTTGVLWLILLEIDIDDETLQGIEDVPLSFINAVNFRRSLRSQVIAGDMSMLERIIPYLEEGGFKILGNSFGEWVCADYSSCFQGILAIERSSKMGRYKDGIQLLRLAARAKALEMNPDIQPLKSSVEISTVTPTVIGIEEMKQLYVEIDLEATRLYDEVATFLQRCRRPLRVDAEDSLYLRRLGVARIAFSVNQDGVIMNRVELNDGLVFEFKLTGRQSDDVGEELEFARNFHFEQMTYMELYSWISAFMVDLYRYTSTVRLNPRTYSKRSKRSLTIARFLLEKGGFRSPLIVDEMVARDIPQAREELERGVVIHKDVIREERDGLRMDWINPETAEVLPGMRLLFYPRVTLPEDLLDIGVVPANAMFFDLQAVDFGASEIDWVTLSRYNSQLYVNDWKFRMYLLSTISWVGALEAELLPAL